MKSVEDVGRRVYEGVIFDVHIQEVERDDGSMAVVETVACSDAVRVYPVTASGEVVLLDEWRAELRRRVLRVVAGRIEQGESPEAGARRELEEELGLSARRLIPFATSRPMIKVRHTVHHVFAADMFAVAAHPEPDEDTRPRKVPVAGIEPLVWGGEILEDVIALNLLRLRNLLTEGVLKP
ncbi:MAG: ADP-ribose pyrophosphatase [Solirubrobacteraceae bacterium]|jgi:ADP-ribose pyrophosphatase|nr:ADP-ribose pyrophosphatase [Solirubrobacteraceae bacterium]